jgi:hypothetical protein
MVVDTNTVRYDTRRIRLVGLDAPELNGNCEDEILLARWTRHRLEELVSARLKSASISSRAAQHCAIGTVDSVGASTPTACPPWHIR